MILIVGLGNPGQKFEKTRHNLGFRVIDELRSPRLQPRREMNKIQRTSLGLRYARAIDEFWKKGGISNFSEFNYVKKFQALISQGKFNNQKIILVKPQTFMNLSGKSVKLLIRKFYKNHRQFQAMASIRRRFENLWVIHDDIDLPLGKIKISIGRGSAGHKGVQSIIDEIGTKNFIRFRVGICPKAGKPQNPERFVLQKFNKTEEEIVKEVIKKTAEAIRFSLKEGLEKAMNRYNI